MMELIISYQWFLPHPKIPLRTEVMTLETFDKKHKFDKTKKLQQTNTGTPQDRFKSARAALAALAIGSNGFNKWPKSFNKWPKASTNSNKKQSCTCKLITCNSSIFFRFLPNFRRLSNKNKGLIQKCASGLNNYKSRRFSTHSNKPELSSSSSYLDLRPKRPITFH